MSTLAQPHTGMFVFCCEMSDFEVQKKELDSKINQQKVG